MNFLGYHSDIELSLSNLKEDIIFGEFDKFYGLYNSAFKQLAIFVPDISNPKQATYAVFELPEIENLTNEAAVKFVKSIMPLINATKEIARKGYGKLDIH